MHKHIFRRLTAVFLAALVAGTYAAAAGPAQVSVPVSCEADNDEEGYTAVIEPQDESYRYTVRVDTVQLAGNGEDTFTLEYTEPGNYSYRIYQQDPLSGGYYDKATHRVKVYVSWDSDGMLTATPVIFREGKTEKEQEIRFLNIPAKDSALMDETGTESTEMETAFGEEGTETAVLQERITTEAGQPNGTADVVQTGDNTQTGKYVLLMAAALAVLAILAAFRQKNNNLE